MSTKEKETKAEGRAEATPREGEAEPILYKWEIAFIRADTGHTSSEYFEAATLHDAVDLAEEKYGETALYAAKRE